MDSTGGGHAIEAVQAGYDATKEGVRMLLLVVVREVIVDIFQEEKMYSLLLRNIEYVTEPDRFMHALMGRVDECQSQIKPTTAHVKHHVETFEEKQSLAQRFDQKFLETTYYPPLAVSKVEAGVLTPPTRTLSETNLNDERLRKP